MEEKSESTEPTKRSYGVAIAAVIVGLLLVAIVIYYVFVVEPKQPFRRLQPKPGAGCSLPQCGCPVKGPNGKVTAQCRDLDSPDCRLPSGDPPSTCQDVKWPPPAPSTTTTAQRF